MAGSGGADSNQPIEQTKMTQEEYEEKLKYLEFVQVSVLHMVGYLSTVYDYAKNNSGPLKPGVQTVEGTVKTVVGPVYYKFHDVPFELLKFVDRKVDVSVNEVERHVPTLVKQASGHAIFAAQKAPEVAKAVASEVQRTGVVGTATGAAKNVYTKYEPTAKEMYAKYEPIAEQYAATTWRKLNKLPLFPQVAHIVVPKAAYCSAKYNEAVSYTAKKGYTVSSYLPLVPTEKIAKVFSGEEAQPRLAISTVAA